MPSMKKILENIVEKAENAGIQHFLLFPQCVYSMKDIFSILSYHENVVCKCFQF